MSDFFDLAGKRVYVAGHTGLVGGALIKALKTYDIELILASKQELDLREQNRTREFIFDNRPDVVLLAAAKVGGIEANRTQPVDFLYDNIMIATNVIKASADAGVERLMNLASNCYYPRNATQPILEESLLTGPFEPTNEAYATAKLAAMRLTQYYASQFGKSFFTLVPTSLYGPGDHFDDARGHVIPALINRFHKAKESNTPTVTLWGSGAPTREFLFVDDAVKGMLFFLQNYFEKEAINLAGGKSVSIRELGESISSIVGYAGELVWDTSKPDGMPHKSLDSERCFSYRWRPETSLVNGLKETYRYYLKHAD
ncbi:GDP-L-fucose synthase family protein [Marinomonas balearica]|uniref:GDP-L-fucose synthase n=1 Tax=Marinomonas balearica TaxID=491947 RepID=A0A4R6M6M5_9GAMM|nr:GDP-L-fucose synthase [Marinomonas balearica]TDO96240.1 GDP-L-fucose synthase [Marinomonas balearica]